MAYRIEYGPPSHHRQSKLPVRLILFTGCFFALFLLGVKIFWPAGRETLYHLLLPVRNNSFQTAADAFLADLKGGVPFYQSLTAFCREVISYAELPAA